MSSKLAGTDSSANKTAKSRPRRGGFAAAFVSFIACLVAWTLPAQDLPQQQIEAAMTLRVLSFTEWPQEAHPIQIGVFEDSDSLTAFQSLLQNETFRSRFEVRLIDRDISSEQLRGLQAIYFSEPDLTAIPRIVLRTAGQPIVLIGAFEDFLEMGGMVNFIKRQRKLSFEIDLKTSRQRGIEYRAKLLRLASRIVEE
ncbi:YfiR family protein [Pelagicoccus sp. SDUM812003]|uniref:YfiR family protein n=1 Tax=Pelagicoccus sp. SDUM812003 TaxID=3041267 RepID=UPI00280D30DB|nr:YfiR family protein [Pelagicoccus sp. SDUM812003]MDQ8201378.1 YfiR family protein [Pelagicoccus sp. SDUM812003]